MKDANKILSLKEVLGLLGEQMNNIRPGKKPTTESVQAARGAATLTNSYIGVVRLGMEYSKMNGQKPDLSFLGMPTQPKQIEAKSN